MTKAFSTILTALLLASFTIVGDAKSKEFQISGDIYRAGDEVKIEDRAQDAFLAGRWVVLEAGAAGNVHAAGENVQVAGNVVGSVYAVGRDVRIRGPVLGQVSAAGQNVTLEQSASVRKGLRAAGNNIVIKGDVLGYALLIGQHVEIDGTIKGDVKIKAEWVEFGKNARIGGTLTYAAQSPVDIPRSVIDPAKVKFEKISSDATFPPRVLGWLVFGIFFLPWLAILLLGFFSLLVFPSFFEKCKTIGLKNPLNTGLVGLGVAIGYWIAAVLLFISLIGLPLAIALVLAFPVFLMLTYLVGVYMLTFAAWQGMWRRVPTGFWGKLGVLVLGLSVLHIVSVLPLLGVIIGVIAVSLGTGSLVSLLGAARKKKV